MDFAAFKAQLEAARRVEHQVDGVTFQITLPTEYQSRVTFEDSRDAFGQVQFTRAFLGLLTKVISGWSGLTQRHLDPAGGTEPVPFSADARQMLLEIRQDIADELGTFVSARVKERREQLEAATKNS